MNHQRAKQMSWAVGAIVALWLGGAAARAAEPTAALRQLQDAFETVAEQTSQSVVVITVTSKPSRLLGELGKDSGESPFEWWFFGPDWRKRLPRSPRPVPLPRKAEGSGFFISPNGYILTNNHVVDNVDKIEVRLKDGRTFTAKVQGADPRTDIAVLKIDTENLPVAKLGDSDKVRVGQWAIAIGAPFELEYTVTVGVISAKSRTPQSGMPNAYEDFLQTDASINPGNSGGPLVDIDGNVIGVNTAIRSDTGYSAGIGFAIPINQAKAVADKLIATGKVVRPWMGIEGASPAEGERARSWLKGQPEGALVKSVHENTPADRAGLEPMDMIAAVDSKKVTSFKELQQEIQRRKVGDTVMLEVWRNGEKLELKVKLEEIKSPSAIAEVAPQDGKVPAEKLGLAVEEFSKDAAEKFGAPGLKGVLVTEVEANGSAARVGLDEGDVITEMNLQPIRSLGDFQNAVKKADLKRGIEVHFTKADTHARTFGIIQQVGE